MKETNGEREEHKVEFPFVGDLRGIERCDL